MSNLYLRKAELSDLDLYYEWANDPAVRRNSFCSELIPYEDHVKWFNRSLNEEDGHLYVLMENDVPVGQIRINISDAVAEISYSISSEFRGKGYGRKIVALLIEKIKKEIPNIKTISARVKPDNEASKKVFEKEGFNMKEVVFELDI